MPTSPDPLHADAASVLAAWQPVPADQVRLRREYLDFLERHPDALSRSNRAGHLTGSALVVDTSSRSVLLTLHPLVGRWLQLGGHVEPADPSLREAACREAVEEGGFDGIAVDPVPLRLDRHSVRCRDGRGGEDVLHHLDVQFLALAPEGAIPRRSAESIDLRWWPWTDLPADTDESVRALVAAARTRLGT